jgi:hypothetical protein
MKFSRIQPRSGQLMQFCEEALPALGAVCERPWHDRLEVLAEGETARLLQNDTDFFSGELSFRDAGLPASTNTGTEVFPGCPLIFRLVEALWRRQIPYSRVCLSTGSSVKAPTNDVAEKLWQAQFGSSAGWRVGPFVPAWSFSVLTAVRCEVQASDQNWSYHRLGFMLPGGEQDSSLEFALEQMVRLEQTALDWPVLEPVALSQWIGQAIAIELAAELTKIKERQRLYLRRELTRIDDYFENYSRELRDRMDHQKKDEAKRRYADRLETTRMEHNRRRIDQIERHTIIVVPHVDALLTVAEPAFRTNVTWRTGREECSTPALFVPRIRRWYKVAMQ